MDKACEEVGGVGRLKPQVFGKQRADQGSLEAEDEARTLLGALSPSVLESQAPRLERGPQQGDQVMLQGKEG